MLGDFLAGFRLALGSARDLRKRGVGRFVLMPVVASLAALAGIVWAAGTGVETLVDALQARLPGWLAWLEWLIWPLFALAVLLLFVYGFTLVANLIGAPFNGLLAARAERALTGAPPPADDTPFVRFVLRSFAHELRKLGYLLRNLVPALLLFVIPGVNLLAPAVWLLLGAWLLAVEYAGYAMDNHGLAAAEQRARLRARRAVALGFGFGMLLYTSVPGLNLVAMPAGVLAGTRLWCEHLQSAQ